MKQEDFGLTVGIKGKVAGWNTDLSSTYGRDKAQIGVADSGNVSLFNDTGSTPTVFSAGAFIASQLTTTLEASKEFDIGWAKPLNVAAGLEHRIDKYEIEAGDAASRYKEGSQSYPGFSLTDAGSHRRTNRRPTSTSPAIRSPT
jgi:iron complex outermembrane receptor protein